MTSQNATTPGFSMTPLVSLNFEGCDPQIFLYDPQNLQFTFFISYEGGHCDPLNRKLRENPALPLQTFLRRTLYLKGIPLYTSHSVFTCTRLDYK